MFPAWGKDTKANKKNQEPREVVNQNPTSGTAVKKLNEGF